ncbi:MAG TPA: Uma2 family endonuclease [Polyangia bacterium]|jgi:Uma2 family endonuclease
MRPAASAPFVSEAEFLSLPESKQKTELIDGEVIVSLDVRFAPDRILQPDAMVFLTRLLREQQGPIDRIPELCVAVLSSDRAYDRITKRLLYAAAGVQEYWVVDPNAFVERWTGPGLAREELLRETLATERLPGFSLDLPLLFADVR